MFKTDKKTSKKGKIAVKDIRMDERDYRAFIAIILCSGLILLLILNNFQGAAIIGTLAGSAVSWYFSDGHSEKSGGAS